MEIYIYGLFNKKTGSCLYIGKSCNPDERFKAHLYNDHKGMSIRYQKMISDNRDDLEMEVLDIIQDVYDFDLEQFWIQTFKAWGFDLANTRHNTYRGQIKKRKNNRDLTKVRYTLWERELIDSLRGIVDLTPIADEFKITPEMVRTQCVKDNPHVYIKQHIINAFMEKAKQVSEIYKKIKNEQRKNINSAAVRPDTTSAIEENGNIQTPISERLN